MSVVFIQLNEINFEIVKSYIKEGHKLQFLEKIINESINTVEEEEYQNLEPWIQWLTCFKGEPFRKHKIFRLGDGLKLIGNNIFTDFSKKMKKSCGAICPMNVSSKGGDFDFFIPDPWSNEKPKGGFSLRLINQAIKKGVNNNRRKKIDFINQIKLLIGLFFNIRFRDFQKLLNYFFKIKKKSFRKALFLDYILVLLHQNLIAKNKTEFSSIFLNAGAHLQHHYFLNSNVVKNSTNPSWYLDNDLDPILEALFLYEELVSSYKKLGYKIILMTGLQQIPTKECEFYYRLDNHNSFLDFLGIKYKDVHPRMTRDFEILFSSNFQRDDASKALSNIEDKNGEKLFGEIEIRDKSIFCSLTFNKEILKTKRFFYYGKKIDIYNWVNFVAIKNGIHNKKGYFFIDKVNLKEKFGKKINLCDAREIILNIFDQYYASL